MNRKNGQARSLSVSLWLGSLPWDELLFVLLGLIGTELLGLVVWAYF